MKNAVSAALPAVPMKAWGAEEPFTYLFAPVMSKLFYLYSRTSVAQLGSFFFKVKYHLSVLSQGKKKSQTVSGGWSLLGVSDLGGCLLPLSSSVFEQYQPESLTRGDGIDSTAGSDPSWLPTATGPSPWGRKDRLWSHTHLGSNPAS